VRKWDHDGGNEGIERYITSMSTFVLRLLHQFNSKKSNSDSRGSIEIVFISSCQGLSWYIDDSLIAQEILSRVLSSSSLKREAAADIASVTVDSIHRTPNNLITFLSSFDVVVATRMHIAILSLIASVPVLPIIYEFKMKELMNMLGDWGKKYARHSYGSIDVNEMMNDFVMINEHRERDLMVRSDDEEEGDNDVAKLRDSVEAFAMKGGRGDLAERSLEEHLASFSIEQ
jgi:polysaccharide pyruvyl transferase WcaK-like protein